jgi:hypothetical protein
VGFLTVSLGIVGAGLLLNLALTFTLVRRVRRHGEQLARFPFNFGPMAGLRAGSKVPELAVRTVSGETRALGGPAGARNAIGFFSAGCPACERQLPEFKEYARSMPGGASRALAVVCGNESAAGELVRELEGAASVVLEPLRGPAQRAMSVPGYPTFYLLDDTGRVEAAGRTVRQVAMAQPARGQGPR